MKALNPAFAVILLIFSAVSAHAQQTPAPEKPAKVILRTFTKGTVVLPIVRGKKEAPESFDYLAQILPANIKADIDKSGAYAAELSADPLPADNGTSFGNDALTTLKNEAADKGADFIVAGIFSIDGKNLTVDCFVFSSKTGAFTQFTAKAELGVIIDAMIARLAEGTIAEFTRNVPRPAPSPAIIVSGEKVRFTGKVEITPAEPGDEVWYTLDGSAPSKEKNDGRKYKGPFSVRESVKVRAVSYRQGALESAQAEKDMIVRDPLAYFTIGFAPSTEVFLGKGSRIQGRVQTSGMSFYGLWETAAVESLRSSAFFRNFGLYFGAAAYGGSSGFSDRSRSVGLGILGAAWLIRASDYMILQLIPMGGYSISKTYVGNHDTSSFSVLGSQKAQSTDYAPWGGFGLYPTFNFASGIFTRVGVTYRHVFYSSFAQTDSFSVDAGLGFRF